MTILINLLAQPSAGKTTLASKLLATLKDLSVNAEFSPEYVKSWAWAGRPISPYDQFYFFGKEAHNQSLLFNKADVVISDSPVLLTAFYHGFYNNDHSLREICKDFYDMAERLDKVKTINFYLPRKKEYIQAGRYQTEKQADEVGRRLLMLLEVDCYPFTYLDCPDEERVNTIMSILRKETNDFSNFTL